MPGVRRRGRGVGVGAQRPASRAPGPEPTLGSVNRKDATPTFSTRTSNGQAADRGGEARNPSDALRLAGEALERQHAQLDGDMRILSDAASSRRKWKRWSIPERLAAATITHPGGTTTQVMVSPRSLSAGGIGFIHGGFLYNGTDVVVHLRSLARDIRELRGTVGFCKHVKGHIHFIGVTFAERIQPRDFLSLNEDSFLLEHVDPSTLHGRILVVAPTRSAQRVISLLLQGTRLEIEFHDAVASALESDVYSYDLILVDQQSGTMDGVAAVEALRGQTMTPVIMFVPDSSKEQRQRACDAGVAALIPKPLNRRLLHRAIAEFLLLRSGFTVEAGPISGTLTEEVEMRDLIECFLRDLDRLADQLETAGREGDLAAVRAACSELKDAGAPHGFPAVSQAATVALTAIGQAGTVQGSANEVRRLVEVCRRCTAG